MKIGVSLPQHTASNAERAVGTKGVLEAARQAEASGLDSVWLIDRFSIPALYDDMVAHGENPSAALRGDTVSVDGAYYRTKNARLLPKSARDNGPPILIGSVKGGPRIRRLTAQYADSWNCYLAFGDSRPEGLPPHRDLQFAACEKFGRDPATLSVHVTVAVQPGEGDGSGEVGPLAGTPERIASQFARLAWHSWWPR